MGKRIAGWAAVASLASAIAGVLPVLIAAPAWAHVDPNMPASGPSVAGPTTVLPYGQSQLVGAASGDTGWYLVALALGVVVLAVAVGAAYLAVRQPRRPGVAGPWLPPRPASVLPARPERDIPDARVPGTAELAAVR